MEGQMEQKKSCGMHWGCCFLPMLAGLAWLIAVISAVSAWWKGYQGIDPTSCYWNALVFGVIALYGHRAKMGSCKQACGGNAGCGSCSGGTCK
jgi:hypothetical protein